MRRAAGSQLLKQDTSLGYLIVPTREILLTSLNDLSIFQALGFKLCFMPPAYMRVQFVFSLTYAELTLRVMIIPPPASGGLTVPRVYRPHGVSKALLGFMLHTSSASVK